MKRRFEINNKPEEVPAPVPAPEGTQGFFDQEDLKMRDYNANLMMDAGTEIIPGEVTTNAPLGEVTGSTVFLDNAVKAMADYEGEVATGSEASDVYMVMCGTDDREYFSYDAPRFNRGTVVLLDPFSKGVVKQLILDEEVEEYYLEELNETEKSFDLSESVFMKRSVVDDNPWVHRSVSDAMAAIKDQMLAKYQSVVPGLLNRLQTLEQQQQAPRQQPQQGRGKNINDLLDI